MAENRTAAQGATIYSVAQRASVSIATVSRVLQGSMGVAEKTRQRVLEAVDQLNYVPSGAARSLAVRHHETHGLVLPELGGPYYAELLVGFETRAAELQQSVILMLACTKKDLSKALRKLATRVDGFAVLGAVPTSIGSSPKPVVIIAGDPQPGAEAIGAENVASATALTEHLFWHGRNRLLFVGDTDAAPDIRERYEGFAAAHRTRGLVPAEPVHIPFRESDGTQFAERLLADEFDADALFCGNDELALAIMARLQDGGLDIPHDVAVVGWDDVMTSRYVRPGLTTVRQPVHELGALAADRLHELVTGALPRAERLVLPTQLVIRSSCGCPPGPAERSGPAEAGEPMEAAAPAKRRAPTEATEPAERHTTSTPHPTRTTRKVRDR